MGSNISSNLLKELLKQFKHPDVLCVGPSDDAIQDVSVLFTSNWMKRHGGRLTVADCQSGAPDLNGVSRDDGEGFGDLDTYKSSIANIFSLAPNTFIPLELKFIPDASNLEELGLFDILIDHFTWYYILHPYVSLSKGHMRTSYAEKVFNSYLNALKPGGFLLFFHDPFPAVYLHDTAIRGSEGALSHCIESHKSKRTIPITDTYNLTFASESELETTMPRFVPDRCTRVSKKALQVLPAHKCQKATIIKKT